MRFTKISDSAFERFIERAERVSITQTLDYVKTRRNLGNDVVIVGVVDGDPEQILAAAVLILQPWKRFFLRAKINYGPIVAADLGDRRETVEKEFFAGLVDFLKANPRVLSARVAPQIDRAIWDDVERGDETEYGHRWEDMIAVLGGTKVDKTYYESSDIQVNFVYSKNIAGMSFADVTKSVSQHVRTAFNRYGTNGVEVRFVSPDEIDILEGVLKHTADRTDMHAVDAGAIAYYREFASVLGPDRAFLPVAVLNTATYLTNIADERADVSTKVDELEARQAKLEKDGKALGKKQRNQLKEHQARLDVLDRRETETKQVQSEHGDEVVLAASLFLRSGNELTYVLSGAYSEFTSYYGIYFIHREMLKWATENGIEIYNFFGMSGDFSEDATDAGVLHFKRQFVGNIEEYLGTYDLPIRPLLAKVTGALD